MRRSHAHDFKYRRLRLERNIRNWSHTEVGELVSHTGFHRKLSQAEIGDIERGERNPSAKELAALRRLFNISPPGRLLEVIGHCYDAVPA